MPRTLRTPRHKALVAFLIATRKKAGLTQMDVAKRLGRRQSFVANVEGGQRRVDVIELLDFAKAIGFDPKRALQDVTQLKRKASDCLDSFDA